jgi:hypothetical protein
LLVVKAGTRPYPSLQRGPQNWAGIKSHTGVAGKLFETLANERVNIDMISTSEIQISVVIDLTKGEQAVKPSTPHLSAEPAVLAPTSIREET